MTARPTLSIIIPTLDEEGELGATLDGLGSYTDAATEVLVVDGGSRDATAAVASQRGIPVIRAAPGRAAQMNAGAAASAGSGLLFLHADTRLDERHLAAVRAELAHPEVTHGSFAIRLDDGRAAYRAVAAAANLRTRIDRTAYGDQAMFVRRDTFVAVGGFPDVPIMEDVMLARSLRGSGRFVFVRDPAVTTSARRWHRAGLVRTTAVNAATRLLWEVGIEPRALRRFYDRALRSEMIGERGRESAIAAETE